MPFGGNGHGKGFKPGTSGNPGGRTSYANALAANGLTGPELSAEAWGQLIKGMRELDPGDKNEGASWRFCVQQILDRLHGKPKETVTVKDERKPAVDVAGLTTAQLEVVAGIALQTLEPDAPTEH